MEMVWNCSGNLDIVDDVRIGIWQLRQSHECFSKSQEKQQTSSHQQSNERAKYGIMAVLPGLLLWHFL